MLSHVKLLKRESKQLNISGFSLIELLVVIAIVITLAAIVYPVMIQSKDAARMVSCSMNLRQIGTAYKAYVLDYDGYAMPLSPSDLASRNYSWSFYAKPLIPYIGQSEMSSVKQKSNGAYQPKRAWICPGDVGQGKTTASYWSLNGSSYIYPGPNGYVGVGDVLKPLDGGKPEYQYAMGPRRMDNWLNTTRDMLLCDCSPGFHRNAASIPSDASGLPPAEVAKLTRSMNVLMLDGHVVKASAREVGIAGNYPRSYLSYVLRYDNMFSRHYNPVAFPTR